MLNDPILEDVLFSDVALLMFSYVKYKASNSTAYYVIISVHIISCTVNSNKKLFVLGFLYPCNSTLLKLNVPGFSLTCYTVFVINFAISSSSTRYDPSTGIYGMDFYVVLERPGYRVGRRRRCKSRVGIHQRVTKDDAMKWFQVKYEGVILNKSQNI